MPSFVSTRQRVSRMALVVAVGASIVGASPSASQLPLEPGRDSGASVTCAYEGWYRNPDGTFALLVGYFNRNLKQELDIPIGPDNKIEPGGPDQGQPTHFLVRRQWGVFSIPVPKDFGTRKLTWTITANGQTTQVPMGLDPLWEVEPFKEAAQGNTPPTLKFRPDGPGTSGPPRGIAMSYEATTASPLTLTAWATDDGQVDPDRTERKGPPVTLSWSMFRGPGAVAFDKPKPEVDKADGKAVTTAKFSEAGEYVLRLQANDVSGEGGAGFQCCWTNAHVKVTVKGK
ncbi:MAG: hypothetical protein U0Q12_21570 [Vicinamibacterales bacterium]